MRLTLFYFGLENTGFDTSENKQPPFSLVYYAAKRLKWPKILYCCYKYGTVSIEKSARVLGEYVLHY